MTLTASAGALRAGLSDPLAALGVDLEDVDVSKAGRRHVVRVVVDRDGGVDLDLVAAVSRCISDLLDVAPLSESLPGPFVLEVTSPGIDRPLTEPRHWRRAVGRLVHVTRTDESVVEGRLIEVPSPSQAVVATSAGDIVVLVDDVRRAVVQVEFNRPDAPVVAEIGEDHEASGDDGDETDGDADAETVDDAEIDAHAVGEQE